MNKTQEKDIDISVCIVSWNVKPLLRECLLSIITSKPELSYEIMVVDNNSADGSPDMVKGEFPSVILVSNQINRGFAAACNQAIRISRGRYVLLLNPDTLIHCGALEKMVQFLDQKPSAGGGGPRLNNPDGTLQPSIRMYPSFKSSFHQFTILGDLGIFHRAGNKYQARDFNYHRASIVDQPMGAALFLRKKALDEVGLLDESFFLYYEEVDLCLRLSRAGWSLWYNPDSVIVHIGGGSTNKTVVQSRFLMLESQFKYFSKHLGKVPTARFKILFKPLFLLGEYWSFLRNLISLIGTYICNGSRSDKERKKNRLRMRWDFFTGYTLDFLLL